jgi:hypothetical protein
MGTLIPVRLPKLTRAWSRPARHDHPSLARSMSIELTCIPSSLVTVSHISPDLGRRSALSRVTGLTRP